MELFPFISAMDSKDGHELKLDKAGLTFSN